MKVPPIGFHAQPTKTFHDGSPLPSANTCINKISFPTIHDAYNDLSTILCLLLQMQQALARFKTVFVTFLLTTAYIDKHLSCY